MQEANLSGEKNFGNKSAKVDVQVVLFQEDKIHFAYMPSLDLSGYGNTKKEALESLTVVLDEFLRYTLNKNTLLLEMKRLGWKIKNKNKPLVAPQMSDLVNTNEQFRQLINSKPYTTSNFQVNVPAFA